MSHDHHHYHHHQDTTTVDTTTSAYESIFVPNGNDDSSDTGHVHHSMDSGNGPDSGKGSHDMHSMINYFHFGYDEIVLFYFWKITTIDQLIGSVVGIFLVATLYEGLKTFRQYLNNKYSPKRCCSTNSPGTCCNNDPSRKSLTDNNGSIYDHDSSDVLMNRRYLKLGWGLHVLQTFLHSIQMILSYLLMLIFMTYNVWLCAAAIGGFTLGYFVFGWRRRSATDSNDHCY